MAGENELRRELFGGRGETVSTTAPSSEGGGPLEAAVKPRKNIDTSEYSRCLQETHESIQIGRGALEQLTDQHERLQRSEMVVDSTGYILAKSARALRSRSLWGKLQNLFSDEPAAPHAEGWQSVRSDRGGGHSEDAAGGSRATDSYGTTDGGDLMVDGFICPECRRRFPDAEFLLGHHSAVHGDATAAASPAHGPQQPPATDAFAEAKTVEAKAVAPSPPRREEPPTLSQDRAELLGSASVARATAAEGDLQSERRRGGSGRLTEQRAIMRAQSEYVNVLLPAVGELKGLGQGIGEAVGAQQELLERLASKTENTGDKAANVTRQAARADRGLRKEKAVHDRDVALQEATTGLFLTVCGEEAVLLARRPSNVCRWLAHHRRTAGIWGLKAHTTDLFLGQGALGGLRVRGKSFKAWEEMQCDLDAAATRLISCSANWGNGGYICTGGPRPADDKGGVSGTGGGFYLTVGDISAECKERAALFRVVDFQGFAESPFATAPLAQWRPPPPALVGGRGGRAGGGGRSSSSSGPVRGNAASSGAMGRKMEDGDEE